MEEKKYSFRDGYNCKANPEIVGKRIEKLEKKNNGEVTPELVVEDAKNEKSPLHNCFEWNNDKAGERYRIQQARSLLGSLVVDIIIVKESIEVRAFVNLKTPDKEQSYCSFLIAKDDKYKMGLILQQAKNDLIRYTERYKIYKELLEITQQIKVIAESIEV
jgi:hypothetical protein